MSTVLPQDDSNLGESDSRLERQAAMIAAARQMFIEQGYGGTSMSAIAAQIGGSKTTLWSYFSSKRAIFEAVIDDLVERYGSAIDNVPLPNGGLEETLLSFSQALVETVVSPEVLQLYRLVVGEAGRFPELGEVYYQKGPGRAEQRLTEFIRSEMAGGRLRRADPNMAALHFLQMCQANHVQRRIMNLSHRVTRAQLVADVRAAVESFLQTYALNGRRAAVSRQRKFGSCLGE